MSDTRIKHNSVKPKQKDDNFKDVNSELVHRYRKLLNEYHHLKEENKVLKDLILEKHNKSFQNSLNKGVPKTHFKRTIKGFYFKIAIGLLVIVLSLGFHIVYLSVTDCLMYNNGNPDCWFKSWLGISTHASFFIDLFLYSLIFLQSLLVILIIRSKIVEIKRKL